MLFYRFFSAFLILLSYCIYKGDLRTVSISKLLPTLLLGSVFYFLQSYLYFSSLDYIGVGLASILLYVYPAQVVLLLWIFKSQKPSRKLWLGIILAFIGVALCFLEKGQQLISVAGVNLALGAALTYSCYLVISEGILSKATPLLVSTFVCLGAAVSYFIKILYHENFSLPQSLDGYLATIALTIFSTAIAILLIFKGIELIGAPQASILSSIEPVTAVVLGNIFMHESLNLQKIIGFCLVLISVMYISKQKKLSIPEDLKN